LPVLWFEVTDAGPLMGSRSPKLDRRTGKTTLNH
jgi:hypothetical protein